ncbi:MAG: type II toxin-antitoxin system HicA family toxin [Commensalibacter sp.]
MKRKYKRILQSIFARPVQSGIRWSDIESLFLELGAEIEEREGSRIAVILFGEVKVFHRPHPSPNTDKGAVASVKRWLEENGVRP